MAMSAGMSTAVNLQANARPAARADTRNNDRRPVTKNLENSQKAAVAAVMSGISMVIRLPCARTFGLRAKIQAASRLALSPYRLLAQIAVTQRASTQIQRLAIRIRGRSVLWNSIGPSIRAWQPRAWSSHRIGACWIFQKVSGEPSRVIAS